MVCGVAPDGRSGSADGPAAGKIPRTLTKIGALSAHARKIGALVGLPEDRVRPARSGSGSSKLDDLEHRPGGAGDAKRAFVDRRSPSSTGSSGAMDDRASGRLHRPLCPPSIAAIRCRASPRERRNEHPRDSRDSSGGCARRRIDAHRVHHFDKPDTDFRKEGANRRSCPPWPGRTRASPCESPRPGTLS